MSRSARWIRLSLQAFVGRQQADLSFHVPGDLYDTQNLLLPYTDHNIGSLTNCTVALMPHKAVIEMAEDFPRIGRALWKETLIDAASNTLS
jgi:hypothetical protein